MAKTFSLQGAIKNPTPQVEVACARGLHLAAEELLGRSSRLVPLDSGDLDRSGVASSEAGSLRAAVSYGTPYAVRQHEDMTLQHKNGRQAKYLEGPARAFGPTMLEVVATQVRRALG